MKKSLMQMNQQDAFEQKLKDKQESKRIRLAIMADLGIKLQPFSPEELELLEKVEAGIANKEEELEAQRCYKEHEADAKNQADMVEAYLYQCSSIRKPTLMIH